MKKPSLSIVIPVYNEESSIGYVLSDAIEHLPKIVKDFEIIVVNDGSFDKTKKIVETFTSKTKRVRLINIRHSGFSNALLKGIQSATKHRVAYMQGNGQDLIRDMVNSIALMNSYDLVLGIRGRRIDYDLARLIQSYGGLLLYRILFGIKHEDVHWTYIWNTSEIKKLTLHPNSGIFMLVESLIAFKKKGLKIGEATAPYRPRYAGSSRSIKAGKLDMFKGIINIKWKSIKGEV